MWLTVRGVLEGASRRPAQSARPRAASTRTWARRLRAGGRPIPAVRRRCTAVRGSARSGTPRLVLEVVDADRTCGGKPRLDPVPRFDARGRTQAANSGSSEPRISSIIPSSRCADQLDADRAEPVAELPDARGELGEHSRAGGRRASARREAGRRLVAPASGTALRPAAGSPSCSVRPSRTVPVEAEELLRVGPGGIETGLP